MHFASDVFSIEKKKIHKQHESERFIKNKSCSFDQNYKNLIEPVWSSTPSAQILFLSRPFTYPLTCLKTHVLVYN